MLTRVYLPNHWWPAKFLGKAMAYQFEPQYMQSWHKNYKMAAPSLVQARPHSKAKHCPAILLFEPCRPPGINTLGPGPGYNPNQNWFAWGEFEKPAKTSL
jgi:hypothetical protein